MVDEFMADSKDISTGQREVSIARYRFKDQSALPTIERLDDTVAVESPLEIRIVFGETEPRKDRSLSITMRTPGNDFELAAGFLLSEGIIAEGAKIDSFEFCGPIAKGETVSNQLRVNLRSDVEIDMSKLQRHFYTTSSCGVCGKASLEAVEAQDARPVGSSGMRIEPSLVHDLPARLRQQQEIFGNTGGLHAAAFFDTLGKLIDLKEDVGRHNAVDKLIGGQLIAGSETMSDLILVVSGRASFELVQKTVMAGVPMMVAVGAPSSLAVDLAKRFNVTLVGFNIGGKFNVYSHEFRIS